MAKAKVVTSIRPQLASKGSWEDKVKNPLWVAEEKFDGTRYLAAVTRTGIRIISRRGVEKTDRLPKLVAELEGWVASGKLPLGSILDGEVVAGSFSETISLVNSLGSRRVDADTSYHYMVFDILREGKEWLTEYELRYRRSRLERIFGVSQRGDAVALLTPQSMEIDSLLEYVWRNGGEGIIVKKLDAPYQQGKRSKGWIKVKDVQTADGVITGFTPGEGKYRDTIGAIVIGQYRNGKFVKRITKISGMTDQLRYELGSKQESYIGRVVEFAFQNKTDESYRHPRFKRFREDKRGKDCTWEDS